MIIYLSHPKYGTKVAIHEDEAKQDEKNGWKRYNLDTRSIPEAAPVAEVKRPGRPKTKELK